jgi:hypothetical protein
MASLTELEREALDARLADTPAWQPAFLTGRAS